MSTAAAAFDVTGGTLRYNAPPTSSAKPTATSMRPSPGESSAGKEASGLNSWPALRAP